MVLIAQVATTAGERTPLASVANQVFLDLVTELERQGVGRKVVADMFGLALRSYQQKVQRISESQTDAGISLWQAVFSFLREQEVVSRAEVLTRFCRDDGASVKSILNDLIETGLVYQTGRGDRSVYRVASEEDWQRVSSDSIENLANVVWVAVYRYGPLSIDALRDHVQAETAELKTCLALLCNDGRVRQVENSAPPLYSSQRCLLPIGNDAGWEAALLDHHQAVIASFCAKLQNGQSQTHPVERLGGSTFSFNVWPGHPAEARAYALLATQRSELSEFWDEVSAYNQKNQRPDEGVIQVTFYCGQYLKEDHS
ncbi:MAG: hypothetical protein RJA70_1842 [Pseudomonadota bacterium]